MAHFAQLDYNNFVVQVITAGNEYEETGESLYAEIAGGVWKKTSYNTRRGVHLLGGTPFRFNFAGIGYFFDATKGTDGAFIPPKPYPSWILNEETCDWEAPVSYPWENGDSGYVWNEELLQWKKWS